MLTVLDVATSHAPGGWVEGPTLLLSINTGRAEALRCHSDRHFLRLVNELESRGYVQAEWTARRTTEQLGAKHVKLRRTAKASDLLMGNIPPDPSIEDGRTAN
jgi:hypothetical protein